MRIAQGNDRPVDSAGIAERIARTGRRLVDVVAVDVIEREVARPLPALKPIPGLEVHRVTDAQPGSWRELVPATRWKTVQRNLARGDWGYLVTKEERLAGQIWISHVSHRDPWSGLHIRLAPDEAYSYAMEVGVAYRGPGVAASMVAAMLSDVHARSPAQRIYGWVDARNRQSQALLRVVFGFTQVQTVKRVRLLRVGWQLPRSDDPRFGPVSRRGRHSPPRAQSIAPPALGDVELADDPRRHSGDKTARRD